MEHRLSAVGGRILLGGTRCMAVGLRHMRWGHRLIVLSNPGTHPMPVSAGIAQDLVSMTSWLVAEA